MGLRTLFSTVCIGNVELKNRIVMAPMGLGYAEQGRITGRLKNFYVERAKGGVGLILVPFLVYPRMRLGTPLLDRDELIPSVRQLVQAIKQADTRVGAQLFTPLMKRSGEQWESIGPSDLPAEKGSSLPRRGLSVEEIEDIVGACGDAARRAREAGCDVVELHALAGETLLSLFLSPLTNKRKDTYGEDLKGRSLLVLRVIEEIHRRAGKDFPIICRFSGEDFLPGGHTLKDSIELGRLLEKAGASALDISTGRFDAPVPFVQASVPQGAFVYLAERVKREVGIPVIGGGRIRDPVVANELLSGGKIDLVFMGRALIADPDLPTKAKDGKLEEIRPCIACGLCLETILSGESVECAVNPQAGREEELRLSPALRRKKVLVIGGGPAGLEAAFVASLRGHEVVLYEREASLGGQLQVASLPPFKEEIGILRRYLIRRLEGSRVKMRIGEEATPERVRREEADEIIVATGSIPLVPNIPGIEKTVTATEVLKSGKETGDRAVIVGGGLIGCETAEFLRDKGKEVLVLEMLPRLANDVGRTARWDLLGRLRQKGVRMEAEMKVVEIREGELRAEQRGDTFLFKSDTIILATGMTSDQGLAEALESEGTTFTSVGDCLRPARIKEAVEAGFRAALRV